MRLKSIIVMADDGTKGQLLVNNMIAFKGTLNLNIIISLTLH